MKAKHMSARTARFVQLVLILSSAGSVWAGQTNLLANPSFEYAYAARRLTEPNLTNIPPQFKALPGYQGEAFMPYGWAMMPQKDSQGVVSRVQDDGKPALRVQLAPGEGLCLRQSLVELVPGATYTFGVSIKGSGRVTVTASAESPGPWQQLCRMEGDAAGQWKSLSQTAKVGWHRHLAGFYIQVSGKADVLIRQAELSAETGAPNPMENLFSRKFPKDGDTLFYEDFDGVSPALKPTQGGSLTDANSGRFGRGLAISADQGGFRAPLQIGELPAKGTMEFWFKPASLPAKPQDTYRTMLGLATQSKKLGGGQLKFMDNGGGCLMLAFVNPKFHGADEQAYTERGTAWGWWQPNTWHHLAGSWDGQALRFYVDGVLEGIVYPPGMEPPQGQTVDLLSSYAGVIDEVRISKVLRYGPLIPVGSEAAPYVTPAVLAAPDVKAPSARELSETDLYAQQAKMTSPLPQCKADYVIGADRFAPAWEGMPGLKTTKDYFGPGADGLEVLIQDQIGRAAYCKLEGIESGDYYVGVWTEVGDTYMRTEYSMTRLQMSAYVNGWPLRFSTSTDPVQLREGLWLAEIQSSGPVTLKNGDEIALCGYATEPGQRVLRLALYRKEPSRGHGVTGRTFGIEGQRPQRLRLVLEPEIKGSLRDGDEHTASLRIGNPLPYAVDAEVTWKLADYFGAPVAGKTETVHIDAHKVWTTLAKFTAKGEQHAYQLDVKTRAAKGFKFPVPRPLDWLDYNDYTRVEFLPNMPSPLTAWNHVRKDLLCDKTSDRKALCLDGGDWESAPLEGRRVPPAPPANLTFKPCVVPIGFNLAKGTFGTWYRKKFTVPDWMKAQDCVLTLRGGPEVTVFVNGKRVGSNFGSIMGSLDVGPAEFGSAEFGAALHAGENELLICVRGGVSMVSEDFVDKFDPDDQAGACQENQERLGCYFKYISLHWVVLRTAPLVRVAQSLIVTDVEKGQLRVFTRVRNEDSQPHKVTLQFQAFQNGSAVKAPIPDQTVTVEAKSVKQVIADGRPGELAPYTPANPVLAKLTTVLTEDNKPLDRFDLRFGYRSLRPTGPLSQGGPSEQTVGMMFNGKPVNLYGAAFRNSPDLFEGMDSVRFARCEYELQLPAQVRDYYDEIGYLLTFGFDVVGNEASWKKLNNQKYWDNATKQVLDIVWDWGSHPSCIGLDVSNESFHYAPYLSGTDAQDKEGERIYSVVQAIRKQLWPGVWCLADGDENIGGRLDFCSFHYLNQCYRTMDFCNDPWSMNRGGGGVSHFSPDCFYLSGTGELPRNGTPLHMNPDWAYGSSACGDTESYGNAGDLIGAAKDMGDQAALSSACQWGDPRGLNWIRYSVEGYRDMQCWIGGSYWKPILGVVGQDVAFVMPQQAVRYYSGRQFNRRINIHDDQFAPGKLSFRWKLVDPAGEVIQHDEIQENSTTAFLGRRRITFNLPTVDQRTIYTLDMRLSKDDTLWGHEQRCVEVWPEIFSPQTARNWKVPAALAVLDPRNVMAEVLEAITRGSSRLAFKKIASLDKKSLSGAECLLVAPDVEIKDPVAARETLCDFTRAGGRTILLHQRDGALLPGAISVEKQAWFSQVYVRSQNHPVMAGLRDLDFQMWNPDHLVAKGAFAKPTTGNVLSLLDSFHLDRQTHNCSWSEMIEVYLGKGSIVAVQLPLVEKFGTEPMAAELFRRLLTYMAKPVYRNIAPPSPAAKSTAALAVLGGATDPVLAKFKEARVEAEFLAKPDPAMPVTMIDLNAQSALPDAALLHSYAAEGGTLILHRLRPEHAAWAEALTGQKVQVQVQPYMAWTDRQVLQRRSGIVDGLNNLDFYWRTFIDGEDGQACYQVSLAVPKGQERGQVLYVVKVSGADDYLFPGGLVEVQVGKGRVVIDQLKWELPDVGLWCGSPTRVFSTMLTNLGVAIKLPAPRPALPPGVTYEMIDLAKVVNRGLRDDKAGDGAGWVDWGPDQDLRDFPTGDVNLGAPFHVTPGDKNCVVLHASPDRVRSLADYPAGVSIPIGKKNVAGLWFLHTAGWTMGTNPFAWREIRYADGSKEVVAINDSNTADWNFGQDAFAAEEVTTTTVAWKGACKAVPVTRVYKTLWVNPHPEKEIAEVVLTTRDQPQSNWRFIAHLAVTAAILPAGANPPVGPANPPVAQRDPKKSQALLQEALKLLADNKADQANAKLQQSVQADDQNIAAWKEWANLTAKTAQPDAATALSRKWIAAMPKSYEAHNMLGQLLEKDGKFPDALKEYRESLRLEWNQPPIVEAAKRVQQKVSP
jgi:hypothetical protein